MKNRRNFIGVLAEWRTTAQLSIVEPFIPGTISGASARKIISAKIFGVSGADRAQRQFAGQTSDVSRIKTGSYS